MSVDIKTVVSVAEMARMVGLSRARFYQLIGSAFPHPVYNVSTKRPFYDEEAQRICLDVRRRNCGTDGRPILFYCRRPSVVPVSKRKSPAPKNIHAELLDGLKALGSAATVHQVDAAMKELFPNGTDGTDRGEVVRAVFIHLRKRAASNG